MAEIARFENNFLKVGDNAWSDDAIEATNVQAIADDVPIKNSAGDDLSGQVEKIEDADGRVWYRLKSSVTKVSLLAKPVYNLVLVPVNGHSHNDISSLTNIQNQLNKIYAQAAVSWNVTTHTNIAIDYASDGVETFNCLAEDSRQYTMDMQHAIDMLNVSPAGNTYYLFVLDQSDDPQIMGLMPYFQEYGFLFLNACQDEDEFTKTIGHELGHGAFGLEHEFFLYPSIDRGDPNLMTWHLKNTNLRKYQWDWIQNPFCMIDGNCGTGEASAIVKIKKNYYITIENKDAFKLNTEELETNSNNVYNYLTKEIYVLATDKNDYIISTNCYNLKNKQISSNIFLDQNKKNEETISFQNNNAVKSEYAVIYYQVNEYILPVYNIELVRVIPNVAFKLNDLEDYIIKPNKFPIQSEISLFESSVKLRPIFLTKEEQRDGVENMSVIYERNKNCEYLVESIKFNNEEEDPLTMDWVPFQLSTSVSNYIIETADLTTEGKINLISDPPYVTVKRDRNNLESGYYIEDYYSTPLYYPQFPSIRVNNNGTFTVNDFLYQIPIVHYKNSTNVKLLLSGALENSNPLVQYSIRDLDLTVTLGQEFSIPTQPHGTKLDILDSDNEVKGQIEFRQITESLLSPTLNFVTINTDESNINFSTVIEDINKVYTTMNVNWIKGNHIVLNGINLQDDWGSNMDINQLLNPLSEHEEYDEKQYYIIIANDGEDFGGFAHYNLNCNWFIHQKSYSNRVPGHELGHCNGLDEYAVNVGNLPAERRNEAHYNAFQNKSTNIMGYNFGNGSDFYSWQIPIIREKISNRINSGQ